MPRILSKLVIALFVLLISLYALVWIVSPYLARHFAQAPLAELGYQLGDESNVRLNLFTASLDIHKLTLISNKQQAVVFKLDQAHLNLDSFGLLDQIVKIDELFLSGIHLQASQNEQGIVLADYALNDDTDATASEAVPSTTTPPETAQAAAEDSASSNSAKNEQPWQLKLHNFQIENFVTLFKHFDQTHTLHLDELSSDALNFDQSTQTGSLALALKLNDSKLDSSIHFQLENSLGSAAIELEIDQLNPSTYSYLLPDDIEHLHALASLKSELAIELEPSAIKVAINELDLAIKDFALHSQGLAQTLEHLNLSATNSQLRYTEDKLSFELAPTLQLSKFEVKPQQTNDTLFSLAKLSTEQLSVSQDDEQNIALALAKLNLDGIVFSRAENQNALFSGDKLELNTLTSTLSAFGNSSSSIASIALHPFTSSIELNTEGELANLVNIGQTPESTTADTTDKTQGDTPAQTNKTAAASQQAPSDVEAQHQIVLDRFYLTDKSPVAIQDNSVKPSFKQAFTLTKLELGRVDNLAPDLATPFEFTSLAGQYGNIALKGDIKAFADRLNLNINTKVQEFSLPKVSPYVRNAAGFDLLAGQFDLNSELKIINDEMAGDSVLKLRGIELERAQDIKQGDLVEDSFIPLNLALGALKDSNDNIEIDVELSGNVNDPNVGLDGFVYLITQKAVLAAAESYAINTFVPYANIITIARAAGSYALKVRVDDLIYPVQQISIDKEQQAFVAGLAAIFKEKPDLQIKMCAIATPAEAAPEAADLKQENNLAALIALAEQRGQVLKEVLIKEHKIESSRVLLCQARIDADEEALPRVEFNI